MYTSLLDTFSDKTYLAAVKADDVDVPINFHSTPRQDQFEHCYSRCPLSAIRGGLLRYWRMLIQRSLLHYLHQAYGANWRKAPQAYRDLHLHVGRDCIRKADSADWWEEREGPCWMANLGWLM
jgi:hypothetical protein